MSTIQNANSNKTYKTKEDKPFEQKTKKRDYTKMRIVVHNDESVVLVD